MTTPIMNVLDTAQQPPFVVGWQELDKFVRALTALYEQQAKDDREAFLIDDCLSLILRHRMYKGTPQTKIQIIERNEQIQGSIEEIARLLLSVARDLNTRLPDSFIEQCRNSIEESVSRFYEIIREAYITPAWKPTPAAQLPEALNNDTFKGILKRGIENKIILIKADGSYKWNVLNPKGEPSKVLLAYFAEAICGILKLESQSFGNIVWNPFEKMFSISGLRGARADWYKVRSENDLFRPDGWEEVYKILHENKSIKQG